MTTIILYPIATYFITYYGVKYATGIALDIAVNKTKNFIWNKFFQKKSEKTENFEDYENIDYENIDYDAIEED